MVSCAVRSCSSRDGVDKKKSGITFHRFPKDTIRREVWAKFARKGHWQPTKYSVLCSKHFSEECFDGTSKCYVRLRQDALPTLYQANGKIESTSSTALVKSESTDVDMTESSLQEFTCFLCGFKTGEESLLMIHYNFCKLETTMKEEPCGELQNMDYVPLTETILIKQEPTSEEFVKTEFVDVNAPTESTFYIKPEKIKFNKSSTSNDACSQPPQHPETLHTHEQVTQPAQHINLEIDTQKPHQSSVCDYAGARSGHVTQHMQTVHAPVGNKNATSANRHVGGMHFDDKWCKCKI